MNLCKVGNQTSSQDPHAVNSRIFVGNLNTFQVNKIDVEKVFQRYGRIVGISMHKGYAFVQFASPFDARSACLGEDGRMICGQIIDVNMVSEPKPHQGKAKPLNKKTGDGLPSESPKSPSSISLEDAETGQGGGGGIIGGGLGVGEQGASRKRSRNDQPEKAASPITAQDLNHLKSYDIPDILICGNCKEMFTSVSDIIDHKKNYCKLRFACKCGPRTNYDIITTINRREEAPRSQQNRHLHNHQLAPQKGHLSLSAAVLLCSTCERGFADPWSLMVHVQGEHGVAIFDAETPDGDAGGAGAGTGAGAAVAGVVEEEELEERQRNEI